MQKSKVNWGASIFLILGSIMILFPYIYSDCGCFKKSTGNSSISAIFAQKATF